MSVPTMAPMAQHVDVQNESVAADALPDRLEPGRPAPPDFTLPAVMPDGSETRVTLSEFAKRHGEQVIVYFYPAAMTPGCTKEACGFRDNLARLTALGYSVLGVSKDPLDKLHKFAQRERLTFSLLSDTDLTVHRSYGAYGERKLYGRTHVGVLHSTFVVDADGHIVLARYNVRATGHVDSLLRTLA